MKAIEKPKCETCGGSREIEVCDGCGAKMQKIDAYPKLVKCFVCGGKPKVVPCPDCPDQAKLCGSCSHFMYCSHERKITHNKNGECGDYYQPQAKAICKACGNVPWKLCPVCHPEWAAKAPAGEFVKKYFKSLADLLCQKCSVRKEDEFHKHKICLDKSFPNNQNCKTLIELGTIKQKLCDRLDQQAADNTKLMIEIAGLKIELEQALKEEGTDATSEKEKKDE